MTGACTKGLGMEKPALNTIGLVQVMEMFETNLQWIYLDALIAKFSEKPEKKMNNVHLDDVKVVHQQW